MRLARAFHRDEPVRRLVDRGRADGEQTVVRQDAGLVATERMRDALALFGVEHHARVVVEDRVVAVEHARVLRQRVERPPERGPRLAVHGVRVRGRHHIGPGGVDRAVDHERSGVDRPVALDHLTLVVDEDEVLHADLLEVHPERVHPEVVEALRVTGGDVPRDAFVEAEVTEQPERGGQPLLAVATLVFDAVERRERVRRAVRGHGDPPDSGRRHESRTHVGPSTADGSAMTSVPGEDGVAARWKADEANIRWLLAAVLHHEPDDDADGTGDVDAEAADGGDAGATGAADAGEPERGGQPGGGSIDSSRSGGCHSPTTWRPMRAPGSTMTLAPSQHPAPITTGSSAGHCLPIGTSGSA